MSKKAKTTVNTKKKVQIRIKWVCIIGVILFFALVGRIGYIQFIWGPQLAKEALEQQTRDRVINSKRGTIYDRNG